MNHEIEVISVSNSYDKDDEGVLKGAEELVISITIEPKEAKDGERIYMELDKLVSEDASLFLAFDEDSGKAILSGMSELHLKTTLDRLIHEQGINIIQGKLRVNYRETIADGLDFEYEYTHKKQSGSAGQYARILATIRSNKSCAGFKLINSIRANEIPSEYIPGIEIGLIKASKSGILAGRQVVGVEVELKDGAYEDVDSSIMAFEICAKNWFVNVMGHLKHQEQLYLIEPRMNVEVILPEEYIGEVKGHLNSKRGQITNVYPCGESAYAIQANVPLYEILGYNQTLNDLTQGCASFSAVFDRYDKVPIYIQNAFLENNTFDN